MFDRSPDRGLLNVSPITDSGLNDLEQKGTDEGVKPFLAPKKLQEKRREISPIYQ